LATYVAKIIALGQKGGFKKKFQSRAGKPHSLFCFGVRHSGAALECFGWFCPYGPVENQSD
jgi:hypothetical protein